MAWHTETSVPITRPRRGNCSTQTITPKIDNVSVKLGIVVASFIPCILSRQTVKRCVLVVVEQKTISDQSLYFATSKRAMMLDITCGKNRFAITSKRIQLGYFTLPFRRGGSTLRLCRIVENLSPHIDFIVVIIRRTIQQTFGVMDVCTVFARHNPYGPFLMITTRQVRRMYVDLICSNRTKKTQVL